MNSTFLDILKNMFRDGLSAFAPYRSTLDTGSAILRAFFGIFAVLAIIRLIHGFFLYKVADDNVEAHHAAKQTLKSGAVILIVCLIVSSSINWTVSKVLTLM